MHSSKPTPADVEHRSSLLEAAQQDLPTGLAPSKATHGHTGGRLVTVFFCGTCANSTDHTNPRYFAGENVSHAYHATEGEPLIDKVIVDGPGSGEKDNAALWSKYYKRPYDANEGTLLAYGIEERINHVLAVLKNQPTKAINELDADGRAAHEKLKSAAPVTEVNIVGWSRGGGAAIEAANRMHRDPALKHIKVNLILIDPVPGLFLTKADNRSLSPNVKSCSCIYARDERSFGFSPVIPDVPPDCKFMATFLPGGHAQVAGDENDHAGDPIPHVLLRDVGIISRFIMHQLLTFHGTRLKKEKRLNLTLQDAVRHYELCQYYSTPHPLRLMLKPPTPAQAKEKKLHKWSIITKEPFQLLQFDAQGNATVILDTEQLKNVFNKLKVDISKIIYPAQEGKRKPFDLTNHQLIKLDEYIRETNSHAQLIANYYEIIAQRVPYTMTQLTGKARKVTHGNSHWVNLDMNEVRKKIFPNHDEKYIDHIHEQLAIVVEKAHELVNALTHEIDKTCNRDVILSKGCLDGYIGALFTFPQDDVFLYRAISEAIQSRYQPEDLMDLDKRCYTKTALTQYTIDLANKIIKQHNKPFKIKKREQEEKNRLEEEKCQQEQLEQEQIEAKRQKLLFKWQRKAFDARQKRLAEKKRQQEQLALEKAEAEQREQKAKERKALEAEQKRLEAERQELEDEKNRLEEQKRKQEQLEIEREKAEKLAAEQLRQPKEAEAAHNPEGTHQAKTSSMMAKPKRKWGKVIGGMIGSLVGSITGIIPATLLLTGILTLPVTFGGSSILIAISVALIVGGTLLGGITGIGIGALFDRKRIKPHPDVRLPSTTSKILPALPPQTPPASVKMPAHFDVTAKAARDRYSKSTIKHSLHGQPSASKRASRQVVPGRASIHTL